MKKMTPAILAKARSEKYQPARNSHTSIKYDIDIGTVHT